MNTSISYKNSISNKDHLIILIKNLSHLKSLDLSVSELKYVEECLKENKEKIIINQYPRQVFIAVINSFNKNFRKLGYEFHSILKKDNIKEVTVLNPIKNNKDVTLPFTEGLALSNYQFLKYFSTHQKNSLSIINLFGKDVKQYVPELQAIIDGTFVARDLVNEPLSYLTAMQYSSDIKKLGKTHGLKVEVLHKKEIEKLKMGGLLAVNKGSIDPPTFNVIRWATKTSQNHKPIVLVGKGIVYDTGGLSLKPTGNSMDLMKSDMAGSAAVMGAMVAVAKMKLNVNIIGLIPATDNRPSQNAYAPGDVITMHDGTTVEVLNTDAEGRLILADALSYAKQYNPRLVIDLATLTGSAARAIGKQGVVAMGNDKDTMNQLKKSGEIVDERLAEFPFWEEYKEDLKSNIADLKNLGGSEAGAITAGKFLEHFTDYPYTHLDIAGAAFMTSSFNYRGVGGTGVGVRLLFNFLTTQAK